MSKPPVLVARAIFEQTLSRLRQHFDVDCNTLDEVWSPEVLRERLGEHGTGHQHGGLAHCEGAPQANQMMVITTNSGISTAPLQAM